MDTFFVSSVWSRAAIELEIANSMIIFNGLSLNGMYYHFVKDSAGCMSNINRHYFSELGEAFPKSCALMCCTAKEAGLVPLRADRKPDSTDR